MNRIDFYIVDVFASSKYEGNQLAVFVDLTNRVSDARMQQIAREINFAETTFIKSVKANHRVALRIFTPEHEVPFAGHPSIGTSYIVAKFLLAETANVPEKLILELGHGDIDITIQQPDKLDESLLFMRQAQPEFGAQFTHGEASAELGINPDWLNTSLPILEVSTGLPYIIIPLKNRAAIDTLSLQHDTFRDFLLKRNKYRTNSPTGHSTSLFFFADETYEADSTYNSRMLLLENGRLSEDAATGSANGCFLAYLLRQQGGPINATVEQGFQIGRKSFIYLDGRIENGHYELNVGGRTQFIAQGNWSV